VGIGQLGVALTAALVLAGALVAGSMAHVLLERPLLRWLRARRRAAG
jgi:peptidoglycan/LPS O-acetylase OafA/YrhL